MQLCLKKAKAAWDAIVYWENSKSGEITSKVSSGKNTLTVVTSGRHSTVIMLMDIHKQAIEKRNWQVEFERQAEEQSNEKQPWDFVYTSFLLFCYLKMQNAIWTFLRFWRKVSPKLCEWMQISWRVVNCNCFLNLHSSGISRNNQILRSVWYFIE